MAKKNDDQKGKTFIVQDIEEANNYKDLIVLKKASLIYMSAHLICVNIFFGILHSLKIGSTELLKWFHVLANLISSGIIIKDAVDLRKYKRQVESFELAHDSREDDNIRTRGI